MSEEKTTIRVGFSKPKNSLFPFVSWLIRFGESFEHWAYTGDWEMQGFSHTYVQWIAGKYGEQMVYEANGTNLRFMGKRAADYSLRPVEKYEFQITAEEKMHLVKTCMQLAGTDYGHKNAFGVAGSKLASLVVYVLTDKRVDFPNPFADGDESQICVEVVINLLRSRFSDIEHPERWGVRQLRDYIRTMPGVTCLK